MPLFVCAYWTSLTFFDPLAVVLLLAKPRLGVMLPVAIITRDVVLDAWVGATRGFQVGAFIAQCPIYAFRAGGGWTRVAASTFSGSVRGHMTMEFPSDVREP
jgi:hypothetical protein